MTNTNNFGKQHLELKLLLSESTATPGMTIQADVQLTNRGDSTMIVNTRLGMGYPESDDRELYCQIQLQSGEDYLGYQAFQVDYQRKALDRESFRALKPGDTIRATFDLQFWYRLTQPGEYQIRVVYEPEPFPAEPELALGPVSSPPVAFTVQPANDP